MKNRWYSVILKRRLQLQQPHSNQLTQSTPNPTNSQSSVATVSSRDERYNEQASSRYPSHHIIQAPLRLSKRATYSGSNVHSAFDDRSHRYNQGEANSASSALSRDFFQYLANHSTQFTSDSEENNISSGNTTSAVAYGDQAAPVTGSHGNHATQSKLIPTSLPPFSSLSSSILTHTVGGEASKLIPFSNFSDGKTFLNNEKSQLDQDLATLSHGQ